MLSIENYRVIVSKCMMLLMVVTIASCGGTSSDGSDNIKSAKQHLESKRLNAAVLELKNALLKDGQNAEARYLLGKIKLEIGDATTTEKEMRRALSAGWDESEATVLLAEALLRQGKYQDLVDEIRAKDKYPKLALANILGLRASAYSSLGQWDDAVEAVDAGESLEPDASWLLLAKARIAIHNNDLATVKETLVKALLLYPDNKDMWLLSAGLSTEEKDYEAAIVALQKVISLDPPKTMSAWGRQAHIAQFRILFKLNEIDKAGLAIGPVIKEYPTDPEANYLAALHAFAKEQYDLTEERLLMVLRTNPEHHAGNLLFGRLSYVQGDYQQAAHYLEKATSFQPGDVPAQSLLGQTYLQLGQYDDAEKKLRLASTNYADNAALLALVGVAKIKAGDTLAGVTELEKAAAINPSDKIVGSNLANAYLASGDTGSAIRTLENALAAGDQDQQFTAMLLLSYVRAAEFDKAHSLADEIVAQYSQQPLSYTLKAIVFEGQGNRALAIENYNQVLSLDADDSIALLGLARFDLAEGKVDLAKQRYQKVLSAQPENAAALVALARLHISEGQAKEAMTLLEKARQVDHAEVDARLILSNYHLILNDKDSALMLAQEALDAAPQNAGAMLAVGRAQLAAGSADALRTLTNLVEFAPTFAEAHYYLSRAQAAANNLPGMQKSLQQAVVLRPDYLQAQLSLARLDLKAGRVDAAIKAARQLQEKHKQDAAVYLLEGDALLANKGFEAAMDAYKEASKYTDKNDAVMRISKLYQKLGNSDAAIETLVAWLGQHEDNFAARFYLAVSYIASGQNEKAYIEYNRLNESYPDNPAILNDLSWLKFEKGEAGALQMAERAHKLSPDNAAIQDTYGWILLQSGRVETALTMLKQASERWPENLDMQFHYMAALAQAGEKDQARRGLDAILKMEGPFAERDAAKALRDAL